MRTGTSTGTGRAGRARPAAFLALTVLFSVPFLLAGFVAGRVSWLPMRLPASALMVACPLAAAAVLDHVAAGPGAARRLLRRTLSPRGLWRPGAWPPVLLLVPAVVLASYLLVRLLGRPLPDPQRVPWAATPLLLALFVAAAAAEEAGWTAYVWEPLRARLGTLGGAVALGVAWAAWHALPYAQNGHGPTWIAGQCLFTVALRVLMVWRYDRAAGSALAAVVVHATSNVAATLFPNDGSHYDPVLAGLLATAVAAAVVLTEGARAWSSRRPGWDATTTGPAGRNSGAARRRPW